MRILNESRFEITWSDDKWKTVRTTGSENFGHSGFSADITPSEDALELLWTVYWPNESRWLGYNVELKIEGN